MTCRTDWSYRWVVYRIDKPWSGWESVPSDPDWLVRIKEILPSEEEARVEVARLTALQSGKGCVYSYQRCRYYPDGRRVLKQTGGKTEAGPDPSTPTGDE